MDATNLLGEVFTAEQAIQRIDLFCQRALWAFHRRKHDDGKTKDLQEKLKSHWLMNFGGAVGALTMANGIGLLIGETFTALQKKVLSSLAATSVEFRYQAPLAKKKLSSEQAILLVESYCRNATMARDNCNVFFPNDAERTAHYQQLAYHAWLMYYGAAVGASGLAHDARYIPENAFITLQQKVFQTTAPRVVGDVH